MKSPNAKEASYLAVAIYGALQKVGEIEKLHEYLTAKRYSTFVEIGTCHGGMSWYFAHLPDFKKLITVDLPGSDFGGGPTEHDKEVIRNWVSTDYDVTLCTGDSQKQETVDEVKGELPNGVCDCLFIDADHTYEGVKRDFQLWSPLVRNGGCVIFHDIASHEKSNPACKVKQFWDELCAERSMSIHCEIRVPTDPDWGGVGVIEVQL